MKNVITFLMCSLCIITGIAQSDLTGNTLIIPEKTPELIALYEQSKTLEQNGTAAEINANRLAIKNAWQEIDPNVAALFKPIVTNQLPETMENVGVNGIDYPNVIKPPRLYSNRQLPPFGSDILVHTGYVDGGVDVVVTQEGDIYLSFFYNGIDFGDPFDIIYIYRSQDNGNTFTEYASVDITSPVRQMQLILLDYDSGENYLLAYFLPDSMNLQALRWNLGTGTMDAEVMATDVIGFSVDHNYPPSSSQRVFGVYTKLSGVLHSARSTAGSYGFDWVDEVSTGFLIEQADIAYGLNGGCFVTGIGGASGNLYAKINDFYNDPTSWGANINLEDGSSVESKNPVIAAARKSIPTEEVVVMASTRPVGSTDGSNGTSYIRENGGAFVNGTYINTTPATHSIEQIDAWVELENGVEVIRTAYVRDNLANSNDDVNRSRNYNGTDFDAFVAVGDSGRDVFDGFASAVAELDSGDVCMTFAGTDGAFGHDLFFDFEGNTLSTPESSLEGFKFYPNPTHNVLNLSAKNTIDHVSIYSILGQKVLETTPNQNKTTIDVASLSNGVYLLKLAMNGQSATYKFIKQ